MAESNVGLAESAMDSTYIMHAHVTHVVCMHAILRTQTMSLQMSSRGPLMVTLLGANIHTRCRPSQRTVAIGCVVNVIDVHVVALFPFSLLYDLRGCLCGTGCLEVFMFYVSCWM